MVSVSGRQRTASGRRGRPAGLLASVIKFASGLALVSICLEYGFDVPPLPEWILLGCQFVAVGLFVAAVAYRLVVSPKRLAAVRREAVDLGLIVVGLLVVLWLFKFADFPVVRAAAICSSLAAKTRSWYSRPSSCSSARSA